MSVLKNRNQKAAKRPMSKADIDFYKMTGVFAIACIFILLVLKMESTLLSNASGGKNFTHSVHAFLSRPCFVVVGLLLFAASAVWFLYCKKKKIDESKRIFTSTNCISLALYLLVFVLCFGINKFAGMHGFFITFTVICAAVYYVSKIFNADFTLFSVITALNVLAVYLMAYRFDAMFVVLKLLVVAASVAGIVLFDKKIKGMKLSKKRKDSFLITPAYVSAVMGALFMFVRFVSTLPSYFASGLAEGGEGISAFMTKLSGFATTIDLKVMFMAFVVEYIVFTIVYTLRLIRD